MCCSACTLLPQGSANAESDFAPARHAAASDPDTPPTQEEFSKGFKEQEEIQTYLTFSFRKNAAKEKLDKQHGLQLHSLVQKKACHFSYSSANGTKAPPVLDVSRGVLCSQFSYFASLMVITSAWANALNRPGVSFDDPPKVTAFAAYWVLMLTSKMARTPKSALQLRRQSNTVPPLTLCYSELAEATSRCTHQDWLFAPRPHLHAALETRILLIATRNGRLCAQMCSRTESTAKIHTSNYKVVELVHRQFLSYNEPLGTHIKLDNPIGRRAIGHDSTWRKRMWWLFWPPTAPSCAVPWTRAQPGDRRSHTTNNSTSQSSEERMTTKDAPHLASSITRNLRILAHANLIHSVRCIAHKMMVVTTKLYAMHMTQSASWIPSRRWDFRETVVHGDCALGEETRHEVADDSVPDEMCAGVPPAKSSPPRTNNQPALFHMQSEAASGLRRVVVSEAARARRRKTYRYGIRSEPMKGLSATPRSAQIPLQQLLLSVLEISEEGRTEVADKDVGTVAERERVAPEPPSKSD
ncbi:hypothetical protein BKA62DRAFT_672189 [Auriculariales sp. MPI-PUGE-AT-0066]|nr:hypothetical protein BKA62DRAFT_672189 [Auriculariales sp. MPI-PUGE-AT-0066]